MTNMHIRLYLDLRRGVSIEPTGRRGPFARRDKGEAHMVQHRCEVVLEAEDLSLDSEREGLTRLLTSWAICEVRG